MLRKKLLVLSKSQHNLMETFNQELADLSLFSNNQQLAPSNDNIKRNGESAVSALLLTPIYQFQQKTIDILQNEIELMKLSYNKLLRERNDQKIELENCQREIKLKVYIFCLSVEKY